MKTMKRNHQCFYYCLYKGLEPILDENGFETGESKVLYSSPVQTYAPISAAYGTAQIELFGTNEGYDKVILIDNPACHMDENTVLFLDKEPEFDDDGTPLYDYIVKRVARSINSVAYGLRKVKVS